MKLKIIYNLKKKAEKSLNNNNPQKGYYYYVLEIVSMATLSLFYLFVFISFLYF